MKLRRLSTQDAGFDAALEALTRYEAAQDGAVEGVARAIIADVRQRGDAAVLEYTRKFDKVEAKSIAELTVTPRADATGPQVEALRAAHARADRVSVALDACVDRRGIDVFHLVHADRHRALKQRVGRVDHLHLPGKQVERLGAATHG